MTSIEENFSEIWDEKISKMERRFRENCGLIIGTSFSMIIFLLSFTKNITLILERGILHLTISIILLFWLFLRSSYNIYSQDNFKKYFKDTIKDAFYNETLSMNGIVFFLLGLVFIFIFFKLVNIAMIIFSFLCVIHLLSTIKSIKFLRKKEKMIISNHDFTSYIKKFSMVELFREITLWLIIINEGSFLVFLYFY